MDESEARLGVIKSLIQSPQASMLRGEISEELIERAEPLVDYVMGKKPKAKPKKKLTMVGKNRKPVEADNAQAPE